MNRTDWLHWRKGGLGSSDAPIVMGVSPWKTPLQLYAEKISSEVKEDDSNSYIKQKGNEIEPKVRDLHSLMTGTDYQVALVEMEQYPFIRASLDGRSPDKKTIIEIKLSGRADFEATRDHGIVPLKYVPQIQHQLMVTRAKYCAYLSYWDSGEGSHIIMENLAAVMVFPDLVYQLNLLNEELKFWKCVTDRKPPAAIDRDYKMLKGFAKEANKLKRLLLKEKELSQEIDEIREKLINAAKASKHPRLTVSGLKLLEVSKAGNIDYKSIPALEGLNLEQYRKPESKYWRIET